MPLPFIIAALGAAASAVSTGVAAVGGAAAVTAAAASAAAVTIGTGTAVALGAATVLAGIGITYSVMQNLEKVKTESYKDGYKNASREFEKKLRNQADEFKIQIENISNDHSKGKENEERRIKIINGIFKLLGEYEGCIAGLKEKEKISPEDYKKMEDTINWLRSFCNQVAVQSK